MRLCGTSEFRQVCLARGRRRSVMRHIRLDTLFHAGDDIPAAAHPRRRPRPRTRRPAGRWGRPAAVRPSLPAPRTPRDGTDAAAGVAEGGVASSAGSPSVALRRNRTRAGARRRGVDPRARASEGNRAPRAAGRPDEDETPERRRRRGRAWRRSYERSTTRATRRRDSSRRALAHGSPSARAHLLAHLSHRRERHCRRSAHPFASRALAAASRTTPRKRDDRPRRAPAQLPARRTRTARGGGGTTIDVRNSDEEEEAAAGARRRRFDEVDDPTR